MTAAISESMRLARFKRLTSGESKGLHGGLLVLLDQGIVSGLSFLTGVLVARSSSKAEFGLYTLCLTILFMAQNVQQSLVSTPYTVFSPRRSQAERPFFTGSLVLMQLVLGAVLIALAYSAGGFLTGFEEYANLGPVLLCLCLALEFCLFKEFARQVNFSHGWNGHALRLDAVVFVLQCGVVGWLFLSGGLNPQRVFLAMGGACAAAVAYWLYGLRGRVRISRAHLRTDLNTIFSFGVWPFLAGITLLATNQSYPWFLTSFHGAQATGELAAVLGIINIINPLMLGIGNYLGPSIMRHYSEGGASALHRFVVKTTILLIACMAVFCVAMALLGGQLAAFVYGPGYAGVGPVIGLMSLGVAADVTSFGFRGGIMALEQPRRLLHINLVQLALCVGLAFALIPPYGKIGVGLTMALCNAAALGLRILAYRHAFSQRGRT
ncbi:lipopolysaccharide biosynthesis protein [Oceanidesulfovibrio marinus]|nr:lipopolysaccharide biosynthesis protein [Oceanidesulfovibrio marinus]